VDTSIAHVTDFLGRPLVMLFGGSSYTVNSPLFTEYRALFPQQKDQKTEGIEPDVAIKKAKDLLD
jgi:ADP-heptose:LPS heptosyltransferase